MRFVGRQEELRELEALYNFDGKRTCAIMGRRRTGKTSLIEEFCRDKRSVFLMMAPGSERQNLDSIEEAMGAVLGREVRYGTFPQFLSELADYCREERTVVVIDELPFILDNAPHVAGYLQNFIDFQMRETETVFIVCGSSVSSMERETADPTRPLYHRFRVRIHMGPMTFSDCCLFHPNMSDIDKARMYLTLGGIPFYHEGLTQETFREAVTSAYLGKNAFLKDEARNVLLEFRNTELCMAILDAVSSGATGLKGISERVGVQKDTCKRCIDDLEHHGILSHLTPMCGAPKHPVYYIRDGLVRFFYDVINRSRMMLINRDPDTAYSMIEGRIDTFLGKRFEDMCSDYIAENYPCIKVGKCWGSFLNVEDGETEDGDIDVVATIQTRNGRIDLFGECKFSRNRVGFTEYNKLERRVEGLNADLAVRYVLFSASGFESDFAEFADINGILLIGLDELIGRRPAPSLFPRGCPSD